MDRISIRAESIVSWSSCRRNLSLVDRHDARTICAERRAAEIILARADDVESPRQFPQHGIDIRPAG